MASSPTLSEISKVLECAICLGTVKNPRRLACEHSFCKSCLDKLLEFTFDGSCIISCPKQCSKFTLIPNNSTTNDLGVDYMMKGMIDLIDSNNKSINLVENIPTCEANSDCNKDISMYCPSCDSFLCRLCSCLHEKNKFLPVLYNTDDEQIKVTCQKHSTDANYLCCHPCDNEFICLYCSHRDHVGHSYGLVENQAKRMKDNLQKEIQNISDFNKKLAVTLQQTEGDISMAKYVLDETLKYRKLLCLNDYLHFLNMEEERLNAEFESITVNHRKQYDSKEDYTEFYKKSASKGGISIVMQTKNILNSISLHNKVNITEETICLSDHCFNANNPLGNINVEAEKGIAVDGVRKHFKSKLKIADMGDKSMGDNIVNLYENLQYLLQDSFPMNKKAGQLDNVLFENIMQENEKMKDNLLKLKEQNEEGQEPLTASILGGLSQREQKQMIAERLLPLVRNLESRQFPNIMDILLKIDNPKLLNMLESPQLLSAEVCVALQYFKARKSKERVARYVERAMARDEKFPIYSSDSLDPNKQKPLTASILATLSLREQKQMIGEKLLPLVQKIEPSLSTYIMEVLLKIDNVKLLSLLDSHELLSTEVKQVAQYISAQRDKERVARYVATAIANDKNYTY